MVLHVRRAPAQQRCAKRSSEMRHLVTEVPHAGQHHRNAMLISRLDDFIIAH
jgi:hypothetical protein